MQYLKQSTTTTIQLGPFLDDTDGKTAETALTIASTDVRLSKNGAAFASPADTNAATHDASGWYRKQLNTTDTNTLGRFIVAVHVSGVLPVWREFLVLPANVYDSLVGGTDYLQVDAIQIEGTDATDQLDSHDGNPPTAAAIRAEIDSNSTQLAAIVADTNELQTDNIPGLIAALNDLDAAGIRTAIGMAVANLDTQLGALPTAAENRAEIDSNSTQLAAIVADTNELQTDNVPGLIAALNNLSSAQAQSAAAAALTAYDPPTKTELDSAVSTLATSAEIAALNDPTAAAIAAAVWDEAKSGHTGSGSFGEEVQLHALSSELTTPPTAVAIRTEIDANSTQLSAILADTNELQTDNVPGLLAALNDLDATAIRAAVWDAAIASYQNVGSTGEALSDAGAAGTPPTVSEIANAVWDEAIVNHLTTGSTGEALDNAGAAGTPPTVSEIADAVWDEAKSGHTGSGSFGEEVQLHALSSEVATPATIADAVWDENIPAHNINSSAGFYTAKVPEFFAELHNLSYEDAQDAVTAALVGESNKIYFSPTNGSDTIGLGSRIAPYATVNKVFTEHTNQKFAVCLDADLTIGSETTTAVPDGLIIVPDMYLSKLSFKSALSIYDIQVSGLTLAGWDTQDLEANSAVRTVRLIDCRINSTTSSWLYTYDCLFSGDSESLYPGVHFRPTFANNPTLALSTGTFSIYQPQGDFTLSVQAGTTVNIYAAPDTGTIVLNNYIAQGGTVNLYGRIVWNGGQSLTVNENFYPAFPKVNAYTIGGTQPTDGLNVLGTMVDVNDGYVDANVISVETAAAETIANEVLAGMTIPPTTEAIADAVLDETLTGHSSIPNSLAAYISAIESFSSNGSDTLSQIVADTNELQSSNIPGLIAALNDPSAAEIAQAVLSEGVASVEDTADPHSLAAAILMMLESSISGTTLTIKKTDGATTFTTKTVTTNASAEPITGVS